MLEFVVGGLYTLLLLALGFAAGYVLGARKLEDVVTNVRRQLTRPANRSGPIKTLTRRELELENDKEAQKMGKVLSDL